MCGTVVKVSSFNTATKAHGGIGYAPLDGDTAACLMFEVRLKDVLKRIAVYPGFDGSDTVRRILNFRKGGK